MVMPSGFPGVTVSCASCLETVGYRDPVKIFHHTHYILLSLTRTGPRYQQALSASAQDPVTPGEPDGTLK